MRMDEKGYLRMIRLMLDIETLSTRCDAHILQVAVVPFDLELLLIEDTNHFDMYVNQEGQEDRHIDVDTVAWWMEQHEHIRDSVFHPPVAYPLEAVLCQLQRWLGRFPEDTRIWCKGPEFDTAILKHAYEQFGVKTPWSHRHVRDVRTATEMGSISTKRQGRGPTHDAVDDCRDQIRDLAWALYGIDRMTEDQMA